MNATGQSVGLVGCGRWGKNILRDLVILGCRVVVVAPCAASKENAKQGGASKIVSRIEDLPHLAGMIVASPASTHAAVLTALLPRNVPIFCEKPLTDNVEAARRLAKQGYDQVFVMDKWRYHCGILELARIARSGELGKVIGLKTNRLGWSLPQNDVDCAWTLLPHELTIALEILGHIPKLRKVTAEKSPVGVLLHLKTIFVDSVWHESTISIRGSSRPRSVELHCAEGMAILPDANSEHVLVSRTSTLDSDTSESKWKMRSISGEQPLLAELRAFLNYLQGGPAPRSSVADALVVVETIEEVRRRAGLVVKTHNLSLAS